MRHIIMRALPALAVCFAGLAFHGCAHDGELLREGDDVETVVPDGTVQMGFTIRLGSDYGASGEYVSGTGYENYLGIAANDFRVLLFDGEGKYMETMTVLGVFPAGVGEHPLEYTVLCYLTKKPEGTFKVMMLANWGVGNYPWNAILTEGVTTVRDVCEGAGMQNTYAYAPKPGVPFIPSAATPIPMYGVKTCENMTLQPNTRNDIGELYLLRAMAKVEVVCREGSGLQLASVGLSRYNTKGFCTPAEGYDNTAYVSQTHIPADAVVDEDAVLDFHISEDREKAVIYIPEFWNTGTDRHCRLSVVFVGNEGQQYAIDFREYKDGQPTGDWFDILRNCCYRFTVSKTPEFKVDLMPYGAVELDPVFGL